MEKLLGHRQTKGPATDNASPNIGQNLFSTLPAFPLILIEAGMWLAGIAPVRRIH